MQVMKILKKNGKINGRIKRVLEKFSDWWIYRFSIESGDAEDYTVVFNLGKTICYPQGNKIKYKALYAKVKFEAYLGELTINYHIYHYEGFNKVILEEHEFTDNCNDTITLFLLKIIQKCINRNIKYIKSKPKQ